MLLVYIKINLTDINMGCYYQTKFNSLADTDTIKKKMNQRQYNVCCVDHAVSTLQSVLWPAWEGGSVHFLSINIILSKANTAALYPALIIHSGCVFKAPPGPRCLP